MISKERILDIVDKIVENYDPDKIILFGSQQQEQQMMTAILILLL